MSMGPGAGGPPWRHLRSDRSVVDNKIERRTLRRVLGFARPHRRLIEAFLAVTVVDAALVVVPPLLLKAIIDDAVSTGDTALVIWLAVLVAVVAVVDAGFGLITGWLSSRIGEGLIYDLRTRVFAHVQRQSLAFFTRTQTGALVSRLNNDVIGAQRAFTSTLQGTVSNIIAAVVVGVTMLFLSWPVTLLCVALFPILLLASRMVGDRLAEPLPPADGRQRRPRQRHDRAVQRRRRDAPQALRATRGRGRRLRREGRGRARPRHPDLAAHPHLLRRDDARAVAGDRARLRHRRRGWPSAATCPSAPSSPSASC